MKAVAVCPEGKDFLDVPSGRITPVEYLIDQSAHNECSPAPVYGCMSKFIPTNLRK